MKSKTARTRSTKPRKIKQAAGPELEGQRKGLLTPSYKRRLDEQRAQELNEELQQHAMRLEEQVRERTAQLNRANTRLRLETEAHQKAARALRESQAALQAIIQNSPSRIYLKDREGRYLHFNQRFASEFNLTLEDCIGKTDAQIFPAELAARLRANDLAVITSASPIVNDEVVNDPDGPRTQIITKFPIFGVDGKVWAVGAIVTDITERRRLEGEILQISEREQRRIAQDLHDGLGQQLTGLWCMNDVLCKNLEGRSSPEAKDAAGISKMLKAAVSQARDLARGLHPVEDEPAGLTSALEGLAARARELFKVDCQLECPEPVLLENQEAATQLYRIAQEAVSNAVKHGRARTIKIGLSASTELIILSISDDGIGFKAQPSGQGLGMRIMSHRAGLIGGTFIVQKRVEGGVKVVCAADKRFARKQARQHEQKTPKTETRQSD